MTGPDPAHCPHTATRGNGDPGPPRGDEGARGDVPPRRVRTTATDPAGDAATGRTGDAVPDGRAGCPPDGAGAPHGEPEEIRRSPGFDATGQDSAGGDGEGRDRAGQDRGAGRDRTEQGPVERAHDVTPQGPRALPPALASALARELLRRAEEDHRATTEAHRTPTPAVRRRVAQCRKDNAEALGTIVRRHAWPTADLVGAPASTAALMILLHATDLGFQLACRDLIAQATADGRCPAPHHAYIADHCAVELGQPQFYGTRVDPATLTPYPVRRPGTLDERRRDVGLAPLDVQMRTLRLCWRGAAESADG